jgi:hypothetical protein
MFAQQTKERSHSLVSHVCLRGFAAVLALATAFAAFGVARADATITNVTGTTQYLCKPGYLEAKAPGATLVIGNRPNAKISIATRVQKFVGNQWVDEYTTPLWAYSHTAWFRGNLGYGLTYFPNYQSWISTGAIPNQLPAAGQMFNYAIPWVIIFVPRGYTYRVQTWFYDHSDGTWSWILNRTPDGYENCRQ